MLLVFTIALLGTNNIYATTPNQQNSEINANNSIICELTAGVQQDVNQTTNIQNTTVRTLNEVQTVKNTTTNQKTTRQELTTAPPHGFHVLFIVLGFDLPHTNY